MAVINARPDVAALSNTSEDGGAVLADVTYYRSFFHDFVVSEKSRQCHGGLKSLKGGWNILKNQNAASLQNNSARAYPSSDSPEGAFRDESSTIRQEQCFRGFVCMKF